MEHGDAEPRSTEAGTAGGGGVVHNSEGIQGRDIPEIGSLVAQVAVLNNAAIELVKKELRRILDTS